MTATPMRPLDVAGARQRAPDERRYGNVAAGLHWIIALLILVQIGLGWTMNEWVPDHSPIQRSIEGVHISLGLTTLLLVLVRIGWRLAKPNPPFPVDLAPWERALATASHLVFYLLILALPLTGWAMVSLHNGPISFWGLPWPHLPGVAHLAGANPRPFRKSLQLIHTNWLIWVVLANLALHVAGALKHQFDGHPVLWRIVPFLKPPRA
jgi:cytochrome b561